MKNKKIVFMGTPTFAVPILEYLISEYNVILVVSQPDREKDKKGNIINTPIKELAIKNNIEVFQPIKIKDDYQKILEVNPDIIITCAYGQILPKIILEYPKYGSINVHGSLLPALRGGAPIHHSIINGDKVTGITVMKMDSKMDAGDIISQKKIDILDTDNLDSLYQKMSYLGRDLLKDTLSSIFNNDIILKKQDEQYVTFGLNITKEEEKIDFFKTSREVFNLVRGLSSIPGAYCMFDNLRLKIYEVELTNIKSTGEAGKIVNIGKDYLLVNTKDYQIKIKDIKLEGKKRCQVSEYLNGIQDKNILIGKVLK